MSLREVTGRALLLGFGLVAALAVTEGLLRLTGPSGTHYSGAGLYATDYDLGHVLAPDVESHGVRTNSLGFRDPERTLAPPPGVFRILGLGDSFTFGSRDPEGIYLRVLEQMLRRERRAVEVINAGVPGYSTLQELGFLRKRGLALGPHLVILGLFVTGDVIENHADERLHVVDGELTSRPVGRMERLLLRLRLWRFLFERGIVRADDGPHRRFLAIESDRLRTCARELRPDVRHGYERTETALAQMADLLRGRSIEFLVLLIPDELQVNPAVFEELATVLGLDRSRFDLDQPNRRLAATLRALHVPFVDTLGRLREAQREAAVYVPDDTHLNDNGVAVVAAALSRELLPRLSAWPHRRARRPRDRGAPP